MISGFCGWFIDFAFFLHPTNSESKSKFFYQKIYNFLTIFLSVWPKKKSTFVSIQQFDEFIIFHKIKNMWILSQANEMKWSVQEEKTCETSFCIKCFW